MDAKRFKKSNREKRCCRWKCNSRLEMGDEVEAEENAQMIYIWNSNKQSPS
jgi:hypothetical protein